MGDVGVDAQGGYYGGGSFVLFLILILLVLGFYCYGGYQKY